MASKMATEKVHVCVLIVDVQDFLLKQYSEKMIYKGFYIPICLSKYANYESTCCSEHIRGTALLSKMTSKIAPKLAKSLLIQCLKQIDID